ETLEQGARKLAPDRPLCLRGAEGGRVDGAFGGVSCERAPDAHAARRGLVWQQLTFARFGREPSEAAIHVAERAGRGHARVLWARDLNAVGANATQERVGRLGHVTVHAGGAERS